MASSLLVTAGTSSLFRHDGQVVWSDRQLTLLVG